MNSIKERIDEIHNGSVKAIMDGITSSSPIEFLNAMIFGTRLGIDNAKFIESVKNAENNETVMMGVQISEFAKASLDILGIKEYRGDEKRIKDMIESKFEFQLPPVVMTGGIFTEKNRMKLYFEWRTAVEMVVVLYGILIVIIMWLKVFEENGTQAGT